MFPHILHSEKHPSEVAMRQKNLFSFLFLTGCCTVSRLSSIWSCGCHRNPDWQVGHPTTKMCHFLKKVFQVTCHKTVALQNPLELFLDFSYQKQLIRIRGWFFFFWPWSCRWLVLDTDSKDLVTMHTDGNEQLSVMSYGPGWWYWWQSQKCTEQNVVKCYGLYQTKKKRFYERGSRGQRQLPVKLLL